MSDEERFLYDVAQILAVARPADSNERLAYRLRGRTSSSGTWHKVKVFRRISRMRKRLNLPAGTAAGAVADAWRVVRPPSPVRHSMETCPGCTRCDEMHAREKARMSERGRLARKGLRPPPSHGASGYQNFGCRCATCCAAFQARGRVERLRERVLRAVTVKPMRFAQLLGRNDRGMLRTVLRWLMSRGRVAYSGGVYTRLGASPGL